MPEPPEPTPFQLLPASAVKGFQDAVVRSLPDIAHIIARTTSKGVGGAINSSAPEVVAKYACRVVEGVPSKTEQRLLDAIGERVGYTVTLPFEARTEVLPNRTLKAFIKDLPTGAVTEVTMEIVGTYRNNTWGYQTIVIGASGVKR